MTPSSMPPSKARSVDGGARPVLGVDTIVVCGGESIGKPRDAGDAERMLEALSGTTHEVVSGLCLRTRAWEELHRETTRVTFRPLTPRDLAHYLASGEWAGSSRRLRDPGPRREPRRADRGRLPERRRPTGALLVRLLATRFPGAYGFG